MHLLFWIARRYPPRDVVFAQFIFWYAFLRIFVDLFREYRVESLGIGTGQMTNISMAAFGLPLTIWVLLAKSPH
ncbi:MAG: prolipoprotein diacylglyceryl transferase family protein [Arenicellales bacterium]